MSLSDFDSTKFKLGGLCKRGHDWNKTGKSLQRINRRSCYECEKQYTLDRREKNRIKCKEWYEQNKERHHEYARNYVKTHREQRLATQAKYREKNRELLRQKNKEYGDKNRVAINAKHRLRYQDPITKQRLKVYYESPQGRLVQTRNRQKHRALKKATHHWHYTKEQIQALYDKFKNSCAYCGSSYRLSIDHWIPLSIGGTDVISNLLPSCNNCNSSKYNNPGKQWYEQQTFYCKKRWKKIEKHLGIEVANGQIPFF